MANRDELKSDRFKKLLPKIYYKLIIDKLGHLEVSEWLLKEHKLDLLGSNKDGKLFSNYLTKYGAIKVAKKSYYESKTNPEILAQTWYQEVVSPNNVQDVIEIDDKSKSIKPLPKIIESKPQVKNASNGSLSLEAMRAKRAAKNFKQTKEDFNEVDSDLNIDDLLKSDE